MALDGLAVNAKVSVGAAPVATGGADYLVNRMAYSGAFRGSAGNNAVLAWAIMKKTDTGDTLIDLSVEDDVLDGMAEKKLFHIKGPIRVDPTVYPSRVNAKLTDIPMRSGDELHLYFQNERSRSAGSTR